MPSEFVKATPSQPAILLLCANVDGLEPALGSRSSIVVPLPAAPDESSKLQTASSPFGTPYLIGAIERPLGPISPLPGSTVDPMTTFFVSFLRIEVLSAGDASAVVRESCDAALPSSAGPEGTAPLPPHADSAKRAPPVRSSAAPLFDNAIVNLTKSLVVSAGPSNRLFGRPARTSDRRHSFSGKFEKKTP